MPGCIIDTLEPVSKMRFLGIPLISADIVGVPCCKRMGTVSFVTAFSGALRRKECCLLYTSLAFPWLVIFFSHSLLVLSVQLSPKERERFKRSLGILFPGELVELAS